MGTCENVELAGSHGHESGSPQRDNELRDSANNNEPVLKATKGDHSECKMTTYLRCPLWLLTAVGFGCIPSRRKLPQALYACYSCFMISLNCLAIGALIARLLSGFMSGTEFSLEMAVVTATTVWCFQCLCGGVLGIVVFRGGKLDAFCKLWQDVNAEGLVGVGDRRRFTFGNFGSAAFAISLASFNMAFIVLGDYGFVPLSEGLELARFFGLSHHLNLLWAFVVFVSAIVWVSSLALFTTACFVVSTSAKGFATEIGRERSTDDNKGQLVADWSTRYVKLYRLSDHFGRTFSVFVGVILMTNIPLQIMLLYVMIVDTQAAGSQKFITLIWQFTMFFQLWCILSAAYLHSKFKSISETFSLWYAKASVEMNAEDVASRTLLECRAIGFLVLCEMHEVGVSGAGLFIVKRQTILTIFSAVITYFIVLVQFARQGKG